MRFSILLAVATIVLSSAAGLGQETVDKPGAKTPDKTETAKVLCPVTDKPVDRDCVVRFRGRWVYFSDDEARKKFEEDPYAYVDGMQRQWEADKPLRVQVRCPVTGETPAENVYIGQGDEAVFFANDDAKKAFLASPEKYRDRLDECFTYQTLCAHSGMPIDSKVSLRFQGRTLYFMCPSCRAAFEKEPEEKQREMAAGAERLSRQNEQKWIEGQLERKRAALKEDSSEASSLRAEIARLEKRLAELRAAADKPKQK